MSGYVRSIEVKVPFDGQDVRVVVKPLTRADLFELQALLPRSKDDPTKLVIDPALGADAFEMYAQKLPGYVVESDVKDAAGSDVPAAEWAASAYFVHLVTAIMMAHMNRAVPENP